MYTVLKYEAREIQMRKQDLPGHLRLRNTKKEGNQEGQCRKAVVHPSLNNMKINGTQVFGTVTDNVAPTTTNERKTHVRKSASPDTVAVRPVCQGQVKEGKTRRPMKLHKEDRKVHLATVSLPTAEKHKQDLNLGLKMRNRGNNPIRHGNSLR